ncbi:MAG: hypothetical protein AMXMBFR84_01210 [Candidatus Hydrogenedentota bacterium]
MIRTTRTEPLRPSLEESAAWLWVVGVIRLVLIAIIALGAYLVGGFTPGATPYLLGFYGFGIAAGAWSIYSIRKTHAYSDLQTVAQMLVDFGVVAATVSFTGGSESFFSFLFVVVILESGVLLGLAQGFAIATLAMGIMGVHVMTATPPDELPGAPAAFVNSATLWYDFFVQTLAYYLTASISGYWNQQVRRLQQFQREILDNMNNGFLIADNSGNVVVLNKAAARILECSEQEALGKPVQSILRDASGGECPVVTALRSNRDFTRYEFNLIAPSTAIKILGLSTSRMLDWRGRATGIIVIFMDLTELNQMREDLKRQDRLAVVGELAAGLAHEIRNPVAAIRGAVDELQDNLQNTAIAEKLARLGLRECDHLNKIVTDFLEFAREPKLRRDVFDVRSLAQETVDSLMRLDNDDEAFKVATTFPKSPCYVSGDAAQIKQVFLNLGKNAVEAMGGKGQLTVVVVRDTVSIETRFEDTGPGIDPDKVARIFEPFYTTKASGVGMGLAICHRIVTAHDGTIRATSREGGGTTLSVRLPATRIEE